MGLARLQRGHATMLTLILFAAVGLAGIGMYNTGRLTTEKVRLQTVADSASYSVSLVIARDMNFKAHTNRAMVANQVVVGQVVGLASWSKMLRNAGQNFSLVTDVLGAIPYVGPFIRALGRALREGARVFDEVVTAVARVLVPVQEGLIMAISEAQRAHHLLTAELARQAMTQVVSESDPDIGSVSTITQGAVWLQLLDPRSGVLFGEQERNEPQMRGSYTASANRQRRRMEEFRVVTESSRDQFTFERSHTWISTPSWLRPLGGRIRKYGGSELVPSQSPERREYVHWTAMDTVGIEYRTIGCGWTGLSWCSWRQTPTPFGYGAAHALAGSTNGGRYNYYLDRNTRRNGRRLWGNGAWVLSVNASAAAGMYGNNNLSRSPTNRGLQPFYDLRRDGRVADDRFDLHIVLTKGEGDLPAWERVLVEGGAQVQPTFNTAEQGGLAGDRMAAIAKSGVYFSRDHAPRTSRGTASRAQREYSNLYNPYWQARLLPSTRGERSLALLAVGIRL